MNDTIVALASAAGAAGIAVVRVSGPKVPEIIMKLGLSLKPRYASYAPIKDNQVIDYGLWLYFPAPDSFTGEHVLEFHGHGNVWLIDAVITRFCELGCRHAEPGEFSKRAFLNDKLDLTQAEAIADLVNASSKVAAKMALASLEGAFSKEVGKLVDLVIESRVQLEAALDFPDEDFEPAAQKAIKTRLSNINTQVSKVLKQAEHGAVVQSGINVVLAGPPNVGKSSMFNALLGREEAIVTDEAGTTRDVLSKECRIGSTVITLQDTAGVHLATNKVEVLGIERAKSKLEQADIIILVLDDRYAKSGHESFISENSIPKEKQIIRVWNKIDLMNIHEVDGIKLSVKQNLGFDGLIQALNSAVELYSGSDGHAFSARFRHVEALRAVAKYLASAISAIDLCQWELAAEDCRQIQYQLNTITGEFSNDDLLGKIFSTFCIGK